MVKGVFLWWCLEGWHHMCQGTVNDRGSGCSQRDPSQGPGKPGSNSRNFLGVGIGQGQPGCTPMGGGQAQAWCRKPGSARVPEWLGRPWGWNWAWQSHGCAELSCGSTGAGTPVEFWPLAGLRRSPRGGWAGTGRAHVSAPWPRWKS